jgi:zinc protease
MAMIAWPVPDFYQDLQGARAAMLTGQVIEDRVIQKVRMDEGATYSPDVQVTLSETFPHYGVAFVNVETPPQKIPGFFADVAAITADLRDHGITADELERARNPRIATIQRAQLTNEYWLARLEGSITDPRRLDIIRTTLPDYGKVSLADVQAAARAWFVDDKAWKLVVTPATP